MAVENTPIFWSFAYSGAAVLGGWGLVEIFLRVDPVYAMSLRWLEIPGLLVFGAALAFLARRLAPGPFRAPVGPRFLLGMTTLSLGSLLFVAVMLLAVSSGRMRSLEEGDIVQEELRRGGLEFSMASLQEALYLLSPRSVELFRRRTWTTATFSARPAASRAMRR